MQRTVGMCLKIRGGTEELKRVRKITLAHNLRPENVKFTNSCRHRDYHLISVLSLFTHNQHQTSPTKDGL